MPASSSYLLAWVVALAACGTGAHGDTVDASVGDDAASDGAASASRCEATGSTMTCTSHTLALAGRQITYELPLGTPPPGGWPIVIYYQGSFVPASHAFSAMTTDSLGQYELTLTIKALLDHGYAVIAPASQNDTFWQTNVPPFSTSWTGCADDVLVTQLLAATTDGTFGPLDATRRYATGISSGGFMTSRMAVSYPGAFRALAIASGSYATCSATCSVPELPADHPPTLFLHGADDPVVPVSIMTPYRDKLVMTGHVVETILHPGAGHEWLSDAKTALPAWFDAH